MVSRLPSQNRLVSTLRQDIFTFFCHFFNLNEPERQLTAKRILLK